MDFRRVALLLSIFAFLAAGTSAYAQAESATDVGEIVVTARRAGAPIWSIESGESTLIVVGSIEGIPRDMAWRPEALEAAVSRADHILLPQQGRASFADLARLIWRARSAAFLPQGTTVADHVAPDWLARLEALKAGQNDRWRRSNLLLMAIELVREDAGLQRRGGPTAVAVVQRAARETGARPRPIGVVRGDDLVELLISAPPSRHLACLEASIRAAEAGPEATERRAEAWRALQVAEVMASPVEEALGRCWPWGDPELSVQLRDQWNGALHAALDRPGVTLAVVPLRVLAEEGGVLDALSTAGLEVVGPAWKAT